MPSTQFSVDTTLTPDEVLAFLTDFGPGRADHWPNVDTGHYEVHATGDTWAEVTEGNRVGWERERYTWDADAGTVEIETLDSNLWAPGPGWSYRLQQVDDGTVVHVRLTRTPKTLTARLLAALIPVAGGPMLGKQLRSSLRRAEGRG